MNSSATPASSPERDARPLGWWRQLLYVLATGFILFFYSERLFWTVFGADASLSDLILTWLAYAAVAYLFLSACWWLRVGGFASVFLCGALFGWLLEGGIAPTLYGTEPSSPFPLSILWTAVAWHATLSVWLGWHQLGRALREGRNRDVVGLSLFFGTFWGLWAMFPWQETPPVQTRSDEFLFHAVAMSLLVVGAYCLANGLQRDRHFQPAPVGLLIALAVWGIFWLQIAIAIGWIVPLILGTLLAMVVIPLWRSRHARTALFVLEPHGLHTWLLSYLLMLMVLPTTATLAYVIAVNAGLTLIPIAYVVLWELTAIGFVLFLLAYLKVCKLSANTRS